MTIVASVNVRDGLVIATDSMTQISIPPAPGEPPQWAKAYSNARKLFQVGDLPMGVAAYGLGNLGPRSVERLVYDFINDALSRGA
jgi:hypothetical protein